MTVLTAIENGFPYLDDIMRQTGLDMKQVQKEIRRLVWAGLIRRKNTGGYEIARKDHALTGAWK